MRMALEDIRRIKIPVYTLNPENVLVEEASYMQRRMATSYGEASQHCDLNLLPTHPKSTDGQKGFVNHSKEAPV
jgi:hypothetical protein